MLKNFMQVSSAVTKSSIKKQQQQQQNTQSWLKNVYQRRINANVPQQKFPGNVLGAAGAMLSLLLLTSLSNCCCP